MLGLSMDKIIILAVIAAFLIGPSRLPTAAAWLAKAVRRLSAFVDGAKDRAREELGEDFDAIEWQKLDPRRYDPRRIIADAFLEPGPSQDSAVQAAENTKPSMTEADRTSE